MTDKELKRLNRVQLLQLLLDQSREIERLHSEVEELNKKLEEKKLLINNSGSIAEAALSLNNIFESAQNAAGIYLENVKRKSEELIASMTPENARDAAAAFETDVKGGFNKGSIPDRDSPAPRPDEKGVDG